MLGDGRRRLGKHGEEIVHQELMEIPLSEENEFLDRSHVCRGVELLHQERHHGLIHTPCDLSHPTTEFMGIPFDRDLEDLGRGRMDGWMEFSRKV